MTTKSKFWPLDFEPEDEIYENLSWDLPGLRRSPKKMPPRVKRTLQNQRGLETGRR
jgi:hypothetical protein